MAPGAALLLPDSPSVPAALIPSFVTALIVLAPRCRFPVMPQAMLCLAPLLPWLLWRLWSLVRAVMLIPGYRRPAQLNVMVFGALRRRRLGLWAALVTCLLCPVAGTQSLELKGEPTAASLDSVFNSLIKGDAARCAALSIRAASPSPRLITRTGAIGWARLALAAPSSAHIRCVPCSWNHPRYVSPNPFRLTPPRGAQIDERL